MRIGVSLPVRELTNDLVAIRDFAQSTGRPVGLIQNLVRPLRLVADDGLVEGVEGPDSSGVGRALLFLHQMKDPYRRRV